MSMEDLVSYFLFFDPATEFDHRRTDPSPLFTPDTNMYCTEPLWSTGPAGSKFLL